MKWIAIILAAVGAFWLSSFAATETSTSSRSAVLVELFTSEGCSSCPPADALLRQLDRAQPIAGAEAIVLSEHVDYWNQIGWKDPFSSRFYSDRQSAYASRFGLASVYTPQMVVDGASEFTGSESNTAEQTIAKAGKVQKLVVQLSAIRLVSPATLQATVEISDTSVKQGKKAEVFLALALDQAQSQVSRGENSGRTLSHTGVLRNLVKVGELKAGEKFSKGVELKMDPALKGENLRVIAFVQESGLGRVLGAVQQPVGK
jgi:hypothetical protein